MWQHCKLPSYRGWESQGWWWPMKNLSQIKCYAFKHMKLVTGPFRRLPIYWLIPNDRSFQLVVTWTWSEIDENGQVKKQNYPQRSWQAAGAIRKSYDLGTYKSPNGKGSTAAFSHVALAILVCMSQKEQRRLAWLNQAHTCTPLHHQSCKPCICSNWALYRKPQNTTCNSQCETAECMFKPLRNIIFRCMNNTATSLIFSAPYLSILFPKLTSTHLLQELQCEQRGGR